MGQAARLVQSRAVTGDGEGLMSHTGLLWLGDAADRSGLTAGGRDQEQEILAADASLRAELGLEAE